MGYSCTTAANNTLAVIGKVHATDGNPNILSIGKDKFFFERGKEQDDGAITGSLMKMLPNDFCRKVGTVRINADGSIARFPGLSKEDRGQIESYTHDLEARNPHLLNSLHAAL